METVETETNIAVVGSRTFFDDAVFKYELEKVLSQLSINKIKFVSGGAIGTDTMVFNYAKESDSEIQVIEPKWSQFGKGSAIIRNRQIVQLSDVVIAFWNNKSKGTLSAINFAKKMNKRLFVINV